MVIQLQEYLLSHLFSVGRSRCLTFLTSSLSFFYLLLSHIIIIFFGLFQWCLICRIMVRHLFKSDDTKCYSFISFVWLSEYRKIDRNTFDVKNLSWVMTHGYHVCSIWKRNRGYTIWCISFQQSNIIKRVSSFFTWSVT